MTMKKNPNDTRKSRSPSLRTRRARSGATVPGTTRAGQEPDSETWKLRLYVAGQTPKSLAAFANLKRLCEQHLAGKYKIEVIDLLENPQLAQGDQILAVPTLVRKMPAPIKKIIGNLANADQTIIGLDLRH